MKQRLIYPYSDELLKYEFRKDHPLKPDRLRFTYELSKEIGLLDEVEVIDPVLATRDELELFHTSEFIDAVLSSNETMTPSYRYGLGTMDNPLFPDIYDAAARYVGATLVAAKRFIEGATHAFCISGGLHHAQRSEASGFCIFNDIVAAIMMIQNARPCRVLYFDFDAHHGDGVQNAFYKSNTVLTISIHQDGRTLFPGTGQVYEMGAGEGTGFSVNVPLSPGSGSIELIRAFDEIAVPLFKSFKPDLLVTQLGVDGHFLDPLAHLTYTSYGYETVLRGIKDLAEKYCKMGWLALGGGGYHPVNVARLWTLFLAIMLNQDVPEKLPDSFIEYLKSRGYSNFPVEFRDVNEVVQGYLPHEDIELHLDRIIRRIQEEIFPYHGL